VWIQFGLEGWVPCEEFPAACLFWTWRWQALPVGFISCHGLWRKFPSFWLDLASVCSECQFSCWSSFSTQGTKFTAICLMFKCWIKMCHHVPKNMPRRLQTLLIIYHLPSLMADALFQICISVTWWYVAWMFKILNQILATNMYTIKRIVLCALHQNCGSVKHSVSPRSY